MDCYIYEGLLDEMPPLWIEYNWDETEKHLVQESRRMTFTPEITDSTMMYC